MTKRFHIFILVGLCLLPAALGAQLPESRKSLLDSISAVLFGKTPEQKELVFAGTRLIEREEEAEKNGRLKLGGYVDSYYAWYSDTAGAGGFQKFPTIAPRSNAFSLNIAQISLRYSGEKVRSKVTLHFGDIPACAWSPAFNPIQEANAGVRIARKVWLDAGFFRTHIGLESIQPRENITTTLATTTYFEPYFLSGAKLTWVVSPRFALQLNAFNSFNTFIENNAGKAAGVSGIWDASSLFSITFNSLFSDDSPTASAVRHRRLYNNVYAVLRLKHMTLGMEANLGLQQHPGISDSLGLSFMCSGVAAMKYMFSEHMGLCFRAEGFYDPEEILTGPLENENHQLVGLKLVGLTSGVEFKAVSNSYLRLEGRWLHCAGDEKLFFYGGTSHHQRFEIISSLGVWF